MLTWLKPEVLIAAFFGLLTVGGTVIANWHSAGVGSALTEQDIREVKSSLADIRSDIKLLPGYEARLASLERMHTEYSGMFGALDGRLRVVEDTSARNSATIEGIKSASGARLK